MQHIATILLTLSSLLFSSVITATPIPKLNTISLEFVTSPGSVPRHIKPFSSFTLDIPINALTVITNPNFDPNTAPNYQTPGINPATSIVPSGVQISSIVPVAGSFEGGVKQSEVECRAYKSFLGRERVGEPFCAGGTVPGVETDGLEEVGSVICYVK